ncbi:MAG: ATP-binding cassette domain-containing protein [Anaerolineales bacterium]|jgi:ABC-2 type transport system ATP-binding protein
MTGLAIETKNLSREFGLIKALENLSIQVPGGSVFGFLGPNGAGKTTTIRLLLGLLEPTGGSAQVLGYDIKDNPDEIRSNCGALLEHSGIYERLSAENNLEFYGRVWQIPAPERRDRIRELLDNLNLWDRRKEAVSTWSRGMKQKLAMARALFHRPKLLFLDEPTAGLDPASAARLRDDLEKLVEVEGVTVFLNTHNLAEAERLCQQIGIISRGKLVGLGSPGDLRAKAGKPHLEISGSNFSPQMIAELEARPGVISVELHNSRLTIHLQEAVETAPLVSMLVSAGGQVEEVLKTQSSLEEVFLTLINENEGAVE